MLWAKTLSLISLKKNRYFTITINMHIHRLENSFSLKNISNSKKTNGRTKALYITSTTTSIAAKLNE